MCAVGCSEQHVQCSAEPVAAADKCSHCSESNVQNLEPARLFFERPLKSQPNLE